MELRLPLEMSPGREAACRAVFGTWGFSRTTQNPGRTNFSVQVQRQEKTNVPAYIVKQHYILAFVLFSNQLIGCDPSTLGRAIGFTQFKC